MADFVRVASLAEVPPGTLKEVVVGGEHIALANVEGELYAVRNNCTHKDYPLTDGDLTDHQVECAWHGARFDIRTGKALALPAIRPVKTYEVKVEGDDVYVSV